MTVGGQLDADVADDGEMIWSVRGAARPPSGPETVAELEKVERARRRGGDCAEGGRADARAGATGLATRGGDEKSVVASGALSLVLGPLGWLYAAPLREAVPGVAIYVGLCTLLPQLPADAGCWA